MKKWFFIADAHLSDGDQGRQRMLIDFLEAHRGEMERLVILGDLFDFWFGFPGYINPAYRPLCDTLLSLTQDGVGLVYLEGNHDFAMGPFFEERLGGEVYPGHHMLDLDGRRLYLAHGDMINPSDVFYRLYRRLLKNKLMYGFIRRLGPERAAKVKGVLSRRAWMHGEGGVPVKPQPYEETFVRQQFAQGTDVVILGHFHRPCELMVTHEGRQCTYYNVGDWVNHYSYLTYDQLSGFRLETYQPSSGRDQAAVGRSAGRCLCSR
ncbi:MAG: UDP-2,3-diacylglucosamine diphosphatase [bacterium]|nr:UDP-2,3-diacylglucosamine diphosphatase [bacterium]